MYAFESPRKRNNRTAKRRSRLKNREARLGEYIDVSLQQPPHHQHQHQDHNGHNLETEHAPTTYQTPSDAQPGTRNEPCEIVDNEPPQMTHVRGVAGDANQQFAILPSDVDEPWQDLSTGHQGFYSSTGSEMSEGNNIRFTDSSHLTPLVDGYNLMTNATQHAPIEIHSALPVPPVTSHSFTDSGEEPEDHVWRETPLQVACLNGCSSAVAILLQHETDLDVYSLCTSSPVHIAALRGHVAIIKQLLQHGASVCWTDYDGNTPFHVAAKAGQREAVQVLADMRADVNARNALGWTALHYAASADNADMIKLLITLGVRTH